MSNEQRAMSDEQPAVSIFEGCCESASNPRNSEPLIARCFSEAYLREALELQDFAGFVRRGGFEAQFADDARHLRHLIGVARRQLALADIDAILQADAHIAAHRERRDADRELEAPRRRDGPLELPEEEPRLVIEQHEVLYGGREAAEDTEHELNVD